jgi:hypothetical protein
MVLWAGVALVMLLALSELARGVRRLDVRA